MAEVAKGYLTLRRQKEATAKRHKEELAPFKEKMTLMENFILRELDKEGEQSRTTPDATMFKRTKVTVAVQEWDVFLEWVKDNEAWHFLVKKAAESLVKDFLEEEGHLPPGISMRSEVAVSVRAK